MERFNNDQPTNQPTKLIKGDCLEVLKTLPDNSIDAMIFDPPYLYLKKHKLDRHFDEIKLFKECFRVLKKNGFLIYFGRGVPFYR